MSEADFTREGKVAVVASASCYLGQSKGMVFGKARQLFFSGIGKPRGLDFLNLRQS